MEVGIEFHVAGELQLKAHRPKSVDNWTVIVKLQFFSLSVNEQDDDDDDDDYDYDDDDD